MCTWVNTHIHGCSYMCIYWFAFVMEGLVFQCMPPVLWTILNDEEVLRRVMSHGEMLSPLPTQSTVNLHFFLGHVNHIWHPNSTLMLRKGTKVPLISTEASVPCLRAENIFMCFLSFPWPFPLTTFTRKQHRVHGMETRFPQFLFYLKWSSH